VQINTLLKNKLNFHFKYSLYSLFIYEGTMHNFLHKITISCIVPDLGYFSSVVPQTRQS